MPLIVTFVLLQTQIFCTLYICILMAKTLDFSNIDLHLLLKRFKDWTICDKDSFNSQPDQIPMN